MTNHKHDNLSVWGDLPVKVIMTGYDQQIDMVYGHDGFGTHAFHGAWARGFMSRTADSANIELHPAGTAERIATVDRDQASAKAMWAKACERDKAARAIIEANLQPATPVLDVSGIPELQAQRERLLPPRRLSVPPVYKGLPTETLVCLYHTLATRAYPLGVRGTAIEIMAKRRLTDPSTGDLTHEGWGDLTAIEHPEGREVVEEPEPLPYTETALAGLLSVTCGKQCHTHRLDTAIGEGLLTFPCDVNEKGLQVRAEVLRRLGIGSGEEDAEPEPPAEPHPQWSEPIEQMSPERCYHVARALGFRVDVRSTFDGADRTYWAFISEWNGLDQDDGPRMATELEAWQSAVVMAARKRDKLVIGVGDRVDLTGLEVRP